MIGLSVTASPPPLGVGRSRPVTVVSASRLPGAKACGNGNHLGARWLESVSAVSVACVLAGRGGMLRGALPLLALATSYLLAEVVLVALRLAGQITWPWIWIFLPLWLPVGLIGISSALLLVMLWRGNNVP